MVGEDVEVGPIAAVEKFRFWALDCGRLGHRGHRMHHGRHMQPVTKRRSGAAARYTIENRWSEDLFQLRQLRPILEVERAWCG